MTGCRENICQITVRAGNILCLISYSGCIKLSYILLDSTEKTNQEARKQSNAKRKLFEIQTSCKY